MSRRVQREKRNCRNCDKELLLTQKEIARGIRCCSLKCSTTYKWSLPEFRQKNILKKKGKIPQGLHKAHAFLRSEEGRKYAAKRWKGKLPWNAGLGKLSIYKTLHTRADGKVKGIKEHRLVKSQEIGRALKKSEIVHHWDEDKRNNEKGNLALLRHTAAHLRLHAFVRRHKLSMAEMKFPQPWLIAK